MTAAQLRAQALALQNQAKALWTGHRDAGTAMPDEDATRYDNLLDQVEALVRQAGEIDTREQRFNVAAAALAAQNDSGHSGGFAASGSNAPHNDQRNTRNGRHGYSLMKALRQGLAQRDGSGRLDGLEAEVHTELAASRFASTGKRSQGVMVPFDLAATVGGEQRALDTTAGVGSIPTILSGDLISILRTKMVTASMGATVLGGMQGLFAIPRQNAASTAYWVAEAGSPTASNQTIDQVAFSPKTVGAYTDYTRRFLEQTSIDAENFVRSDLMEVIARGLELAGLNGLGSSNQPLGIGQNSGITTIALGTNGLIPTWASLVAFETAVAVANADMGKLGYIFNTATRGILKVTPKIGTTFPVFMWDSSSPNAPINGYPVGITNLLPKNLTKGSSTSLCSMGLFGNWADLVFALWSGIDLLTDPYTGSSSGTVRVVALQDADVNVRHTESFAKCIDILTA